MATRATTNIKKRNYRLMYRVAAAYTRPTSAALFATFLATLTELGYCRQGSLKSTIETAEMEIIDTGVKVAMGYNGKLEGEILQTAPADYTEYEGIENTDIDLFLYDESGEVCIFYPYTTVFFQESVVGGDTEIIPFIYEKDSFASKSDFRDRFAEPTT